MINRYTVPPRLAGLIDHLPNAAVIADAPFSVIYYQINSVIVNIDGG